MRIQSQVSLVINAQSIAILLLWSLALVPNFPAFGGLPVFRFDDVIITFMLIVSLQNARVFTFERNSIGWYVVIVLALAIWIAITMIANSRLSSIGDYFEFYKLFKYIAVAIIFCKLFTDPEKRTYLRRQFVYIFIVLLVFNLLSLLDSGPFNKTILPLYTSDYHLQAMHTDLSSDNNTRLLGTMGNPNNNALLWCLFASFFIAMLANTNKHHLLLISATLSSLLMFLLTQSRTAFVGLLAGGMIFFFVSLRGRSNIVYKVIAVSTLGIIGYFTMNSFGLSYLSSLWKTDLIENTSLLSRFETWDFLYGMIVKSPWFGYGPNKDFFYARNLFAENEYVLMAWRYGYIGVLFYLLLILFPWFLASRFSHATGVVWAKIIILMGPFILVAALTNNPMADPRFALMYAIVCGLMFAERKQLFKMK